MRPPLLGAALALTVIGGALLTSAQPARAVDVPTNDVTLDMEVGVPLFYPFGLSVFNLYWDSDWDAHNPGFARADIDAATKALADSNYFDKLYQYGVPDIKFSGSAQAASICGGTPGSVTSTLLLIPFLQCEEATPGTGVPYSFGERIYNVIVPTGTKIFDIVSESCSAYGAYHFIFPSLPGPVVPPVRPIIFTVIPAKCVSDVLAPGEDGVAKLMWAISHEAVEAATDPNPLPPFQSWIDNSTVDTTNLGTFFGTAFTPLRDGEASDICEKVAGFQTVPVTYGGIAMQVASYWSNADNACVVGTSRVVSMTFAETGVPTALRTLDVGGTARAPGTSVELEGTTFAFPAMITDPLHLDVRYVQSGCTGGPASGTVTFPAGNVTANASASISCAYAREVFVRIATAPAAAMTGNTTLTSSQWVTAGTALSVTGDQTVAVGTGSRYDFRGWSDGSVGLSLRTAAYWIDAPVTITASYRLQHQVDFDQTGIPSTTTWHVNVAGSNEVGPASRWVDAGATVAFSYESPVAGTAGTRYVLSGSSTSSPLTVASPVTVTGTYGTEYLLHVSTSGLGSNHTGVVNGSVSLGSANDVTSVERWFPGGTVVALRVDDPVNGLGGVQYFFNGFDPAPPATLTAPFSTTANYRTMAAQIDAALSSGAVKNAGLANSYRQEWAAVTADLAAAAYADALGDIKSFINHLDAQAGKGVTAGVAQTLRLDAAAVYHYALCQAVAAGQITPAEHAASYAWYSALVTSLGGTPKPNC